MSEQSGLTRGGFIKKKASRGGEQLSSNGHPPPLPTRYPPGESVPYQAVRNLQHQPGLVDLLHLTTDCNAAACLQLVHKAGTSFNDKALVCCPS